MITHTDPGRVGRNNGIVDANASPQTTYYHLAVLCVMMRRQVAFKRGGMWNSNDDWKSESAALELSWTDATIKNHVRLDLLLYEQAVAVHKEQLAMHGI